mgnify:CR=1 FL=1
MHLVDVIPYAQSLGADRAKKYALDMREDIYVCRRR